MAGKTFTFDGDPSLGLRTALESSGLDPDSIRRAVEEFNVALRQVEEFLNRYVVTKDDDGNVEVPGTVTANGVVLT